MDDDTLPLALGTMHFGAGTDETTAFALLDRFVDAGGVWIDTANAYQFWASDDGLGGTSERTIGRWLAARAGVRDRVRISTKIGAQPTRAGGYPDHVEGLAAGAVRYQTGRSQDRLGVDRIDMLWAHVEDRSALLGETVGAFAGLVADGTIGSYGFSNHALWRVERARQLALHAEVAPLSAVQQRYSYVQPRPFVRGALHDHRFGWLTDDHLDHSRATGTALWAYTPLLTGSYDRDDRPLPEGYDHPGTTARLTLLGKVAADLGVTPGQVVLAWLAGGDLPVRPVVGVSSATQLDAALTGVRLRLDDDVRGLLDATW
mgnify:CR=1 FL=1